MAEKGIWPPTIKVILKTHYTLPCAESELLGEDQIERDSLEALANGQKEEQSPSPLPCAEPESSGYDQIESDFLEAPEDGQEEERLEIPLLVRPDDMMGNIRNEHKSAGMSTGFRRRHGCSQARVLDVEINIGWYGAGRIRKTAVDGFSLANGTRNFLFSTRYRDEPRDNFTNNH